MKTLRITLVPLLLLFALSSFGQGPYHVTRVHGTITNLSDGIKVVAGDEIAAGDILLFESLDSYAIAIDHEMNRFQLKMSEMPATDKQLKLMAAASEVANPTQMRNLMLARFDPLQSEVSDLRQYFGNDKFSIIGDSATVQLNEQTYPLTDDKFIVFYYKVDNNPVSKKIGYADQSLLLEKDKLVSSSAGTIDGDEISNLTVYEYQMSSKSSREITRFTLVFVDKKELINEFNTIIPILKRQKMADGDIKKYLIEYYYDFYGATDSKTIDAFAEQIVKSF